MSKTILITGATDGIGKLTAKLLVAQGHHVLIHGRSLSKLNATADEIGGKTQSYVADLSDLTAVKEMADLILTQHERLDVLINNAGVFKTSHPIASSGLDVRFLVNTISPYVLTQRLLPIIPKTGRVVNLSSAAQARVNLSALSGQTTLDDMGAYAQSKLGITLWTVALANTLKGGPVIVAVNPGSLLASKMVKEGFGVEGSDLSIGANILCKAALDDSFADASGRYFDNDAGRFSPPNRAATDPEHIKAVMHTMKQVIETL